MKMFAGLDVGFKRTAVCVLVARFNQFERI
jgi:hypothetical protein